MPKIAFLIAAILIAFVAVKAATHQILRKTMETGTEVVEGRDELPREVVEDLLDDGSRVLGKYWISEEHRQLHSKRVEQLFAGRNEEPPRWAAEQDIADGERVWRLERIYENDPGKRGWSDGIAAYVFFDKDSEAYWYVTSGGIAGWTHFTGPVAASELD